MSHSGIEHAAFQAAENMRRNSCPNTEMVREFSSGAQLDLYHDSRCGRSKIPLSKAVTLIPINHLSVLSHYRLAIINHYEPLVAMMHHDRICWTIASFCQYSGGLGFEPHWRRSSEVEETAEVMKEPFIFRWPQWLLGQCVDNHVDFSAIQGQGHSVLLEIFLESIM